MTIIKAKSDYEYLLMDAILILLGKAPQNNVSDIQYELLRCGIMVQQPLLREALNELEAHGAIKLEQPLLKP